MINCMIIEELEKRSKLVYPLIDMYKKGDARFASQVIIWLEKNEEIIANPFSEEEIKIASSQQINLR